MIARSFPHRGWAAVGLAFSVFGAACSPDEPTDEPDPEPKPECTAASDCADGETCSSAGKCETPAEPAIEYTLSLTGPSSLEAGTSGVYRASIDPALDGLTFRFLVDGEEAQADGASSSFSYRAPAGSSGTRTLKVEATLAGETEDDAAETFTAELSVSITAAAPLPTGTLVEAS
ncbi:MAG: hypothetical protein ACO3JL_20340, partial [Myxococcota bacterium]